MALDRALARMGQASVASAAAEIEAFALFIGYPGSGHTLLGMLLNAHREAVIVHELKVLRYAGRCLSRARRPGPWSAHLTCIGGSRRRQPS
jgi:hypothetical protein